MVAAPAAPPEPSPDAAAGRAAHTRRCRPRSRLFAGVLDGTVVDDAARAASSSGGPAAGGSRLEHRPGTDAGVDRIEVEVGAGGSTRSASTSCQRRALRRHPRARSARADGSAMAGGSAAARPRARRGRRARAARRVRVMSPSRRGGTSRDRARCAHRASSGGTAVSGSTDAPPPAATRSAMSRMPSTSTGTVSVTPVGGRGVARPRRAAGSRPAGGSAAARPASRSGTGRVPSIGVSAGTSPTRPRRGGARRRAAVDVTGSVTTACASSPVEHLGASRSDAPSLTRSCDARRDACAGRRRARARATGSRCRRCRSCACPVWRPCSIERSLAQRLELAADAAGPLEHRLAELGRDGAPPAPHEELDAELGLELADLLGDVRLDGVEAVGGGRERARPRRPRAASRDGAAPRSVLRCAAVAPVTARIGISDGYYRI